MVICNHTDLLISLGSRQNVLTDLLLMVVTMTLSRYLHIVLKPNLFQACQYHLMDKMKAIDTLKDTWHFAIVHIQLL